VSTFILLKNNAALELTMRLVLLSPCHTLSDTLPPHKVTLHDVRLRPHEHIQPRVEAFTVYSFNSETTVVSPQLVYRRSISVKLKMLLEINSLA